MSTSRVICKMQPADCFDRLESQHSSLHGVTTTTSTTVRMCRQNGLHVFGCRHNPHSSESWQLRTVRGEQHNEDPQDNVHVQKESLSKHLHYRGM